MQSGGTYNILRSVIAGGGEISSGGNFSQTSTIGQGTIGQASGGAFSVSGGFWQGTVCNAPAISQQPASQTVCAGSAITFSVTATGTGLAYQWRKNGANVGGATSASFNIPSVVAGDAGNYDVAITGGCGTQTSNVATLTVNAGATISSQPTGQTVCVTQPVSFSVTAAGAGLSYQWRKNNVNISGATGSSFSIPAAALADAGTYDVVITAACGSLTSTAATLTITPATVIALQPTNQTVCAGASASFSVNATGAGLSYQWRKGGINIGGATASSYSIAAASANNAGNYDVVVMGTCGPATSSAATLTVNPATVITIQPSSQNTTVGQSVTFSVTTAGIALTYQWRKGSANIGGATSSSHTINSVAPGDAGNYDVVVTGTCGSITSNPATLTVGCQTITVNPPASGLPAGTMGSPYSQNFSQTGGLSTINWSNPDGGLPGGLTLNNTTGELSGTPTTSGAFAFTIRATDANNCFGERSYTLQINNAPCPAIIVSPINPALAAGTVGTSYSQTFTQTNGAGTITWSTSAGTLPAGLTLNSSTGVLSGMPASAGNSTFTIRAADANQCFGERQYTLAINPAGNGLQFYPLSTPVRLLDTRAGFSGCVTGTGAITANATRTQPARTVCSTIPANATAIIGNITVVPAGPGYLTLFPSNATQPTVANSNFKADEITNNFFTVGLGTDGAFKIFTSATTDVIIDLTGYYAPPSANGLYYHPLPAPVRLVETRAGLSGCFQPPQLQGTNNANANPSLDLQVQGRSPGLPSPCNAIPNDAVVLVGNATTVFPNAPFGFGYLTIYPSDAARPTVASSNHATGDVINGPFAVKLGVDGKFKIYTFATTHLVVDISGYYSASPNDANGAGLLFNPLVSPMRLLETRPDFPGFPLTGCYRTNAPIAGDPNIRIQQAWGPCADQPPLTIPNTARALVGNVTVLNPVAGGFLTFFPGNVSNAPTVATSNYPFPVVFGYNRHYYVGLSPADGTFKMLTQFTTDLIVDISGFFAP